MHIKAGIQAVHCRRQFKMTAWVTGHAWSRCDL